jgi:aromatic ring-opening dioxygenase catalytic subunit (LigB family)
MAKQPVLFISHGGGPWPWIPELKAQYKVTSENLTTFSEKLPELPKAILCISAHWETPEFTVSTAPSPDLIYDYSGFPPHAYQIMYAASGSPEIAGRVGMHLAMAGINIGVDPARGFDHGVFVPMCLMFPEGQVPIVTLSIKKNFDPAEHIRLGEALVPLREEGILIVGSGLTYHNLKVFNDQGHVSSREFEDFCAKASASEKAKRAELLKNWRKALCAQSAHPREDHLVPLFVCAGAAGSDTGERLFTDTVDGIVMGSYRFG